MVATLEFHEFCQDVPRKSATSFWAEVCAHTPPGKRHQNEARKAEPTRATIISA
jgi:hypothetical protein